MEKIVYLSLLFGCNLIGYGDNVTDPNEFVSGQDGCVAKGDYCWYYNTMHHIVNGICAYEVPGDKFTLYCKFDPSQNYEDAVKEKGDASVA